MKDNIILITTDQQRFDTIQALGNDHIFTPHLNYMVSEGVTFTRCYADCPICVPSRTTIMTGKRGFDGGVTGNGDHQTLMSRLTNERKTLPAILTDNGYQTKAMGKMHFIPARAHYGFEEMELPLDYLRFHDKNQQVARPKAHGLGECSIEPVISTVAAKDSITAWTVDQSIDFVETRDPLRPFFMWTSFTKPHPPFDPCLDYWLLYDTDKMPPPTYGDWSLELETTPQGFLAGTYENSSVHLHTIKQMQAVKRAYYAMITQVDYALGSLFGCLRENGLFENTWLLFTADHGEMLGDHHAAQKNLFFEGSAHVPMIIVPPKGRGLPRNIKVDTLAQMADIYPTILDIAGIDTGEELQGTSLLKLEEERVFYGNTINTHFCVMKDNVKLIYCRCGGHYLLFDMDNDSMEQHNLTEDKSWQSKFAELKQMLLAHVTKTAPEVLENGDFIVLPAPKFPGDVNGRWYGFHYKDYTVDTFH